MSDNYETQSGGNKSFLKVVLLIAAVLILAGIAYIAVSNMSSGLMTDGETVNIVEGSIDGANPFPETQEFNIPPMDEMVDEEPHTSIVPQGQESEQAVEDETGDTNAEAVAAAFDVEKAMAARGLGDPNAPIKLQEYFSLTCSHCANFHNITLPHLRGYIDRGEVYIEFHEFPLNAPALRASMVARCLPENKYYGYITLLFKTQDSWITNPDYLTPLRQNAKLAGMSDEEFDACLANNELQQAIAQSLQDASTRWQIESTPTFVVNNGQQTIKGAQPAYEFERVFREVSGGKIAPLMKDEKTSKTSEPGELAAEETTTE